ncbi:MAG: hypothetical protein ABIZ80_09780 [Bryobacteraceae bacterium]
MLELPPELPRIELEYRLLPVEPSTLAPSVPESSPPPEDRAAPPPLLDLEEDRSEYLLEDPRTAPRLEEAAAAVATEALAAGVTPLELLELGEGEEELDDEDEPPPEKLRIDPPRPPEL